MTVDRYDEINTFVQCQVDSTCFVCMCALLFVAILDSHITIGALVLDMFEDAVAPLINSSLELAAGR